MADNTYDEAVWDITTATLMRINEICHKLDYFTVTNKIRNPAFVKMHYGFLKSLYNNLQIMISDDDKKQWDEVFKKLDTMIFSAAAGRMNPELFDLLDKTEMELRRLQKKVGFSVQVKQKINVKAKMKRKLVS